MARLLAWISGALGGLALYRLLTRRRPAEAERAPVADERAEELRRKLDESRALVEERDEFEGGELTVDRAEPGPPNAPDERRREVHERARAAAERMRDAPAE